MALDGIAAIQTRIQTIEQQVAGVAAPSSAATAASGTTTGADFASLLSDAMNTEAASSLGDLSDPGSSDSSSTPSTSGVDISSLMSEAGALTGSGSADGLSDTSSSSAALTSLVSSLTGGSDTSTSSPDLTSLLSSLTGSSGGSTGSPDLSSLISALTGSSGVSPTSTVTPTPNAVTTQFVNTALSQQGKPYVWGATASATDPSPAAFDCSELTKWAAARSGVTIPDGAAHQYVWLKQQGATMSVQQALQTPGALLFHFDSEPQPGLSSEPPVAHVAISLGNGYTIEAKGHAYGVGVFPATGRFNYAGMIPGMS